MDWSNLTINKCPKCNKDLTNGPLYTPGYISCGCGFNIGEQRYKEIVASMKSKELEKAWGGESVDDFYD